MIHTDGKPTIASAPPGSVTRPKRKPRTFNCFPCADREDQRSIDRVIAQQVTAKVLV